MLVCLRVSSACGSVRVGGALLVASATPTHIQACVSPMVILTMLNKCSFVL